jgi:protein tyrosine/serine phosphatase
MNVRRAAYGRLTCAAIVAAGLLCGAVPQSVLAEDAAGAPIERFHRVDDRLYRGAQPAAPGFRYLQRFGIRTVVNLRDEDAGRTGEQQIVESLGMRYVHLPVKDGNFFTRSRRIPEDTIRAFFNLIDAPDAGPVFVHCQRGADRTGALVGFYRIARNGWTAERAYDEARSIGMRSWYTGLKRQIEEFGASLVHQSPPAPVAAGH